MNDKERTIELANVIKNFFLNALEDAKTDNITKIFKKASYFLKGEVEFNDEVDEEAKEPLKSFIDAICQIMINICNSMISNEKY